MKTKLFGTNIPEDFKEALLLLVNLSLEQIEGLILLFEESTPEEPWKIVNEKVDVYVKSNSISDEDMASILKMGTFLVKEWAIGHLKLDDFIEDFRSLGLTDEQIEQGRNFLKGIEQVKENFYTFTQKGNTATQSIPILESIGVVSDLRPVFRSEIYNKDQDDSQGYFQIIDWLPISIIEIVTTQEKKKNVHTFQLGEKELEEAIIILQRTQARLKKLKEKIEILKEKER